MDISKKTLNILISVLTVVFAAGTIMGSIYFMRSNAAADGESENYLNKYVTMADDGINSYAALKNSLEGNIPYLLLVFAGGFFRAGIVLVGYSIIKKGFVIGFTAAACIKVFGFWGVLMTAAMLPGILVMLPSLLFFSSISTDFAVNPEKRKKKFIIFYVFLCLIMLTIFCVAAVCDGYLSTIFMKQLSGKLIQK